MVKIDGILRNKERIKELYDGNAAEKVHQTRNRVHQSKFGDINDALY